MGACRDFLNQALLDQRHSVYQDAIQPGCYKRWRIFAVTAYGHVYFSHNFQNDEIFMTKQLAHCAPVPGYNGPLGGTHQIY